MHHHHHYHEEHVEGHHYVIGQEVTGHRQQQPLLLPALPVWAQGLRRIHCRCLLQCSG